MIYTDENIELFVLLMCTKAVPGYLYLNKKDQESLYIKFHRLVKPILQTIENTPGEIKSGNDLDLRPVATYILVNKLQDNPANDHMSLEELNSCISVETRDLMIDGVRALANTVISLIPEFEITRGFLEFDEIKFEEELFNLLEGENKND